MPVCPLNLGSACYCARQVSSFLPAADTPPAAHSASVLRSTEAARTAVLLLAHGSPENPDQIPDFLRHVTGGRSLPPQVVEEIRRRYALIGFSPLP